MKNKLDSKKIIERIKKERGKLKASGVKKIGLFGSFAKGKQNKKSDIDFLVEFRKINSYNFFSLLFLLENMFKRKVDLVIEADLKPELKYVKREAKYVKI